jgi:hypothetical protein
VGVWAADDNQGCDRNIQAWQSEARAGWQEWSKAGATRVCLGTNCTDDKVVGNVAASEILTNGYDTRENLCLEIQTKYVRRTLELILCVFNGKLMFFQIE